MGSRVEYWIEQVKAAYGEPKGPLAKKILIDQVTESHEGSRFSLPINGTLSLMVLIVQLVDGYLVLPLIWFASVSTLNIARRYRTFVYFRDLAAKRDVTDPGAQLKRLWTLSGCSGVVWAGMALLSQGFTIPQSSFYLVMLAGICAGAVAYGSACAPVAINFITPALAVTVACLLMKGDLQNYVLAFAVVLFWVGLVRGALLAQQRFREASRLKHEAKQTASDMEIRSHEDPLTGLLNRRGLENAVYGFSAADGPFIVMLIDLDGFKSVNDTYGHKVGDDLLAAIAASIAKVAPPRAALARTGGDEFVLLYPEAQADGTPEQMASRIIGGIAAQHQDVLSVEIGACVGICRLDQLDLVDMLLRADFALYTAKRRGRNEHHLFEEKLHLEWERKQSIERDLRAAIETQQIQTRFQPVVELCDGRIVGFEALLRWEHPQHGFIAPPEIIDIACEVGVIRQLTRSVIASCCTMIEMLCKAGRTDLTVAMNLSPRELSSGSLPGEILGQLAKRGLPPHMLEIEITEETPFELRGAIDNIRALSGAGLSIALDDFGTGFATFVSLKGGLFDKIKIDKVFVQGIARSKGDRHVVHAIVELGRALGIAVTAEGIETREDCDMLRDLGCHSGQGFLFFPAMPLQQALEALREPQASPDPKPLDQRP